jgi:hypothetical protein
MAVGAGKYDDVCTFVRVQTQAAGALVVVLDGAKGDGFSLQGDVATVLALPELLEHLARQIRADRSREERDVQEPP